MPTHATLSQNEVYTGNNTFQGVTTFENDNYINGGLTVSGSLTVSGNMLFNIGATGTFTSNDSKSITVVSGIITAIEEI